MKRLVIGWTVVIVLAVLGFVGLWFNPSNLFCSLLMMPCALYAAVAPNGGEPQ